MCKCDCVPSGHPQRSEEGLRSPGARVTGVCNPPEMSAGKQPGSGRAADAPNHGNISPGKSLKTLSWEVNIKSRC